MIDAVCNSPLSLEEKANVLSDDDIAEMEVTFSRGFGHGWLDGADHRTLVSGQSSSKRGVLLGTIQAVRRQRAIVKLAGSVRRGDGIVFEGDRGREDEQGGRVYEIFQGKESVAEATTGKVVELAFRNDAIDFTALQPRQKTSGKPTTHGPSVGFARRLPTVLRAGAWRLISSSRPRSATHCE